MSRAKRLTLLGLAGILVGHTLLAAVVAVSLPPGEGPDEPSHLAYARWILTHGELPTIDPTGADPERRQAKHPPLYYLTIAGVGSAVGGLDVPFQANPYHGFNLDNPDRIPAFVWSAEWSAADVAPLWWVRAMSVLAGAVVVAATFVLTRTLAPQRLDAAVVASALVAFTPQVVFMSGVVNSDALGNALGAVGITALCLYLVRPREASDQPGHTRGTGPDTRRDLGLHVGLGLLIGFGLLTKTVLLALLPAAALAVLLGPDGPEAAGGAGGPKIRRRLPDLALVFGTAGVVAGPWFIRNLWLYGDPLALGTWGQAASDLARTVPLWRELDHYLVRVAASFVGRLGWAGIPLPWWSYALFGGVAILTLAGWLRRFRRGSEPTPAANVRHASARQASARRASARQAAIAVTAVYVLGILAVTLALAAQTNMVAAQGRYLFPALAPIGAAVGAGWSMLWPGPWRPIAATGLVAAVLGVAAHMTFEVIPGIYRPVEAGPVANLWSPTTGADTGEDIGSSQPGAAAAGSGSEPSLAEFAAGLTLRSVAMVAEADAPAGGQPNHARVVLLSPGGSVRVVTRWSAVEDPEPSPLVVFAHLIGPDGEVAARSDPRFFQGRFPPVAWEPGRVYEQPIDLVVNGFAPEGPATLLLGLYREGHPDTRIPIQPVSQTKSAYAAPIDAVIASEPLNPSAQRDIAEFRNGAVLRSAELSLEDPDSELTVALEWWAARPLDRDWQVFLHLIDPDGALVATADGPPGPYWPTSAWVPGVPVHDTREVDLTSLAPGPYEVRAGLYDLGSGERASIRRSDTSDQSAVILGVVHVR